MQSERLSMPRYRAMANENYSVNDISNNSSVERNAYNASMNVFSKEGTL